MAYSFIWSIHEHSGICIITSRTSTIITAVNICFNEFTTYCIAKTTAERNIPTGTVAEIKCLVPWQHYLNNKVMFRKLNSSQPIVLELHSDVGSIFPTWGPLPCQTSDNKECEYILCEPFEVRKQRTLCKTWNEMEWNGRVKIFSFKVKFPLTQLKRETRPYA